jgi:hypothetical protein
MEGSGCGTSRKSASQPSASVKDAPPGFATTASFSVPGGSAGAFAVRNDGDDTEAPVAAAPPTVAEAPSANPAPVIATDAPPEEWPTSARSPCPRRRPRTRRGPAPRPQAAEDVVGRSERRIGRVDHGAAAGRRAVQRHEPLELLADRRASARERRPVPARQHDRAGAGRQQRIADGRVRSSVSGLSRSPGGIAAPPFQ